MKLRTFLQKVGKKLVLALVVLVVGLFPVASASRALAAPASGSRSGLHQQPYLYFYTDHQNRHASACRMAIPSSCGVSRKAIPPSSTPVLCCASIKVIQSPSFLNNTLPQDVSIIFPGQENVLADGSPTQPVYDSALPMIRIWFP